MVRGSSLGTKGSIASLNDRRTLDRGPLTISRISQSARRNILLMPGACRRIDAVARLRCQASGPRSREIPSESMLQPPEIGAGPELHAQLLSAFDCRALQTDLCS
jgi:hypothetical protein